MIEKIQPDIIFHLAAQALVKKSYKQTLETFLTNTVGTLNILDIVNNCKKISLVLITSDKVYKNINTKKNMLRVIKLVVMILIVAQKVQQI